MFYYHYINNGEGPKKLFIGGVHGNEGLTSFYFLKNLKKADFSKGQIYIINFDKSEYISTLNKEYYSSNIGKKIISLLKDIKPDFYTELHCYDIKNLKSLVSEDRFKSIGIPPLINIGDFILVSSISPFIRFKYLPYETVCKTLEFPCFDKLNNITNFNKKKAIDKYIDFIKMICLSDSRKEFENKMRNDYPKEYELALKYTKKLFGEEFPLF